MTAAEIAECLGMALSTVSRWLNRVGLGRLSRLEPPEPANRYERRHAGELVHLDAVGSDAQGFRATGDRASRGAPAYQAAQQARLGVRPRLCRRCHSPRLRRGALRRARSDGGGLHQASGRVVSITGGHGRPRTERQRSLLPLPRARPRLPRARPQHLFTRPYRPRTNGKAERFIQTLLNEWTYESHLWKLRRTHRRPGRSSSSATTSKDDTAHSATDRPRQG